MAVSCLVRNLSAILPGVATGFLGKCVFKNEELTCRDTDGLIGVSEGFTRGRKEECSLRIYLVPWE